MRPVKIRTARMDVGREEGRQGSGLSERTKIRPTGE